MLVDKRKTLLFVISLYTVLTAIFSVVPYPSLGSNIITIFKNTYLLFFVQFTMLFFVWLSAKYFLEKADRQIMVTVRLYLIWNLISAIRGIFIAETYWDWKQLVGVSLALFVPLVAYLGSNKLALQSIFSFFIKYALPLFFIFAFLISTDAYGFYLVPVAFLILFFPTLTLRWKLILMAFVIFVVMIDFGARSNVIKFVVPTLLGMIYYFKSFTSRVFFDWTSKILFILPIILFCLALTNTFNIFKLDEYISGTYVVDKVSSDTDSIEDDLKSDTRTFLYIEVLQSAQKYNSWLIGRSLARGNESETFGSSDESGRGERGSNEVAILNIFTWTGIIGVALYLLVFYKASYFAINHSNNIFSKILGIFIAFRWVYAWVEDVNYFTLSTLFLWLMIGLCFSNSFRAMNDAEVKNWVRGIFDKKERIKLRPSQH